HFLLHYKVPYLFSLLHYFLCFQNQTYCTSYKLFTLFYYLYLPILRLLHSVNPNAKSKSTKPSDTSSSIFFLLNSFTFVVSFNTFFNLLYNSSSVCIFPSFILSFAISKAVFEAEIMFSFASSLSNSDFLCS